MTALLSPSAKQKFFTDSGALAAGYLLYTYAANSVTPQATYTNRAGTVANANPIVLDSRGEAVIYLPPGVVYDYVLKTGAGVEVWTREDVSAQAGDAAAVNFTQSGTGARERPVSEKLQDHLCILDFVPPTERDAILDGTSTYDATSDVQAAITEAITQRRALYAPGHYRLTSVVTIAGALTLFGDGCEMQVGDLGNTQTRGGGSWFHIDHTGIGFTLNDPTQYRSGMVVEKIGTYRTQPSTTGGSFTPTAHDFDFKVERCDAQFRDVCVYNATKGLRHLTGGYGRLQIDGFRGQPLSIGIQIDDAADTCRIRNVHFWPFFSNATVVRDYMKANAKAIVLNDVDNPDLWGIFTLGYGYSVSCEPLSGTLAMPLKIRLSNFDFDNGGYGFRIATGGANGVTALLSHGYILGVSTGGPANASNIDIGGNNNSVMIDNVGLDLPQDCNIKVGGTGNTVRCSNLTVGRWNFDAGASFGIEVATGNKLRLSSSPIISQAGTTTNVFGGAGTISCPLGNGSTTATTDASGFITVTHGLDIAPRVVNPSTLSTTPYVAFPTASKNSTTFGVQIRDLAGAVVASTSVSFDWSAFY